MSNDDQQHASNQSSKRNWWDEADLKECFPSLRFSEEISYMTNVLYRELSSDKYDVEPSQDAKTSKEGGP